MHALQGLLHGRAATEAAHQLPGFVEAAAHAEAEGELARLARLQPERHLDRSAGIERDAAAARQVGAAQRGGTAQRAIAAYELGAVTSHRAGQPVALVDIEEADPVAEVVAV